MGPVPSTKTSMRSALQRISQMCAALSPPLCRSRREWAPDKWPTPPPCAFGVCVTAETTLPRRVPKSSMISISPHTGHPTDEIDSPSIQKAGQTPCSYGSRMRARTRPYVRLKLPCVFIRADVYAPLGLRAAVRLSHPSATLAAVFVYCCNSRLPHPFPTVSTVSNVHVFASSESNSSAHTCRHGDGAEGGAGGATGAAGGEGGGAGGGMLHAAPLQAAPVHATMHTAPLADHSCDQSGLKARYASCTCGVVSALKIQIRLAALSSPLLPDGPTTLTAQNGYLPRSAALHASVRTLPGMGAAAPFVPRR
jgi:hypothetical protein